MLRLIAIIILLSSLNNSYATDLNYSLALENRYFTNVNRVNDPVSDEQLRTLAGEVSISESSSFVQADLRSSYRIRDYLNDLQEDENLAQLNANILWLAYPGRLEWLLTDVYTQVAINTLDRAIPSNRQDVNILTFGPNYFVRLNSVNTINIEGRLIGQSFENNADNKRVASAVRYIHNLNSHLNLALNIEGAVVKFDDPASDSSFDRNDLFFNALYSRGGSQIGIEFGYVDIDIDSELIDKSTESRYRLFIESLRSNTSSLNLELSKNVVDRGSRIANSNEQAANGALLDSLENNLSIITNSALGYVINSDSVNVAISVSKQLNEGTVEQLFDSNSNGLNIRTSWPATRGDLVALDINARNRDFVNQPIIRKDQDRTYALSYTYRARRNINLNYRLSSIELDSTDDNLDFKDKRFLISVEYFSN